MISTSGWRSFIRSAGGFCSILFSLGLIAFSVKLPDKAVWRAGQPAVIALIAVGIVTAVYQPFINVGDHRRRRQARLEDACLRLADHLDSACPGIALRSIGVHIWQVRGCLRWRRLHRVGQFLLRERASSDVTWRPTKGVMGLAWDERAEVIADLETELYPRVPSKEAAEAIPLEDRFNLEWDEIQRTRKYKAIFASPLLRRTLGRQRVAGILAIDVLESGHYAELVAATIDNEDFNAILGVCQDALRS